MVGERRNKMKTNDGLTQTDIDHYDSVVVELLILLNPSTVDAIQRCDDLCDLIWEAAVIVDGRGYMRIA